MCINKRIISSPEDRFTETHMRMICKVNPNNYSMKLLQSSLEHKFATVDNLFTAENRFI